MDVLVFADGATLGGGLDGLTGGFGGFSDVAGGFRGLVATQGIVLVTVFSTVTIGRRTFNGRRGARRRRVYGGVMGGDEAEESDKEDVIEFHVEWEEFLSGGKSDCRLRIT